MKKLEYKKKIFFIISLLLLNISIFTDFLPYNTILKIIAMFFMVIELLIRQKRKILINEAFISMLLLSLIIILNIFIGGSGKFILTFCLNVIIMILIMQFPEFSRNEIKIVEAMCIMHLFFMILVEIIPVSVINSIFSKIILARYNSNYAWRVLSGINVGITQQPGVCAMYMVMLSGIFFAKIVNENKKLKYSIGYMLSLCAIFLTTKRSAILFSIITIGILLLFYSNKRVTFKSVIKTFSILGIIIILFYYFNLKFDILYKIQNKNVGLLINNDLSNGRTKIWKDSLDLFFENPIFGIGLKTFYDLSGYDIHNTYLQFLVETGIVGFITFFACIGIIIKKCINMCKEKYENNLKNMSISTIVGLYMFVFLMLYGLVGNTFIDYLPLSLYIISLCLILNDFFYEKKER